MTWLWQFDSRGKYKKIRQEIQKRKFYATLPIEIDYAVDMAADIIDLQIEREKRRPKLTEKLSGDTPLGGEIRIQSPFVNNDDPEPPTAA